MATEAPEIVTISIPREEWEAHKQKVEGLCNLINGVMSGMANSPLAATFMPPDVIAQIRAGKV